MKRKHSLFALMLAALVAFVGETRAAPKHDFCADVGGTFAVGISSYSSALGWPEKAQANGVKWSFLYYYVTPNWDPALGGFIASKATIANGLSAEMVITFYNLYARGVSAGLPECTSDAPCVQAVLKRADLMKAYFDEFIDVLVAAEKANAAGVKTVVHVEPDSWGFMMWSFGVDGQTDATKVPVMVKSSGHPDLAAFSDDASGFGKALVALRDKYAPDARLGWHASNFRVGTRPEVVTSFYAGVGEWDLIVTEEPHIVTNSAQWWNGLDAAYIDANTNWFRSVSSTTHLPILIWQEHVGAMEYYLFADPGGPALVTKWMSSGVVGMMWEHQCYGGTCPNPSDPDTFRGVADDDTTQLGPPPASFGTGAAIDLRTDLAKYQKAPIPWPTGSICAKTTTGDAGADAGPDDGGVGNDAGATSDGGTSAGGAPGSGCGCELSGRDGRDGGELGYLLAITSLIGLRRRGAAGRDPPARAKHVRPCADLVHAGCKLSMATRHLRKIAGGALSERTER